MTTTQGLSITLLSERRRECRLYRYIRGNARRLPVRMTHPGFFRRVNNLRIGDNVKIILVQRRIMHQNTKNKLQEIPFLKLMLILGVVVIHSNIKSSVTPGYSQEGVDIVKFIVSLMRICVPSFFIISGYLFFYRVNKFTLNIYKEKLYRRVKTLVIPYVLWDIFCACLFLFKVYFLHFNDLGIVENNIIQWGKFFQGFIFIEQAQGAPYAFAFWFIRNLIVFSILTPVVWLVARRWWSVVLFFVIIFMFEIVTFGIEWFILGAACSLNHITLQKLRNNKMLIALFGAIYLLLAGVREYCELSDTANQLLFVVEIMAAFCFLYSISLQITNKHNGKILHLLYSATFFIYAFHQCFCSVNIKFWISVFGCNSVLSSLASFLASFLTLVSVSLIGYGILRRIAPRFLAFITGGRS